MAQFRLCWFVISDRGVAPGEKYFHVDAKEDWRDNAAICWDQEADLAWLLSLSWRGDNYENLPGPCGCHGGAGPGI